MVPIVPRGTKVQHSYLTDKFSRSPGHEKIGREYGTVVDPEETIDVGDKGGVS